MKQRKQFLCILLAVVLLLSACGAADNGWQEQYDLGMRYLQEGNYEEAILAFTAAIAIDDQRPEAYMARGVAFAEMDEPEKAMEDFWIALELVERNDPDNEELREELELQIEDMERIFQEEEAYYTYVVKDAYWEVITNPNEDEKDYCYHIPEVSLLENHDPEINQQIYDQLIVYVEENLDEDGNIRYGWIAYEWYSRMDVLSLVVSVVDTDGQNIENFIFNILLETGTQASDREILQAYDMEEDEFQAMVAELTGGSVENAKPYVGPDRQLCVAVQGELIALKEQAALSHAKCLIDNPFHIDGHLQEDEPVYEGYIFYNGIVYRDWIDNMQESGYGGAWSTYGIRFTEPITVTYWGEEVTFQEASLGYNSIYYGEMLSDYLDAIQADPSTGYCIRVRVNCEIFQEQEYCEPGYGYDPSGRMELRPNGQYDVFVTHFEIVE